MTHIEQAIRDAVSAGYKGGTLGAFGWERMVLDPKWWQALGKARGWTNRKWAFTWEKKLWWQAWHNFIDHLAEGKDAESFFSELV